MGQSGAAARFNITPEQFAIIAQGGSLPQEQLQSLLASSALATAEAVTTIAAPETAAAATTEVTATEAKTEKKSSKKSSKKLSSQKKQKGCCQIRVVSHDI